MTESRDNCHLPLRDVLFHCEPVRTHIDEREDNLFDVLRGWSRAQEEVVLTISSGTLEGILTRARRDHLEVCTRKGTFFVPSETLVSIRLSRGD